MEWRSVIKHDVVKRVGNDFGQPNKTGLHVFEHEQLHGAEQQSTETDHEPDLPNVTHKVGPGGVSREYAE
jgi:hypothetical protein